MGLINKNFLEKKGLQFEEETLLIAKSVPTKSTIIDVGSNIGSFTEVLLKRGHTVISIEPISKNIQKQAQMFSRYIKKKKLYLHNVACSDKSGKSTLFISSDTNGIFSTMEKHWMSDVFPGNYNGQSEIVETVCLSDLLRYYSGIPKIQCVKIDTEGHDAKVIAGLFYNLPQTFFPKLIMFEFNTRPINRQSFNDCISLLRKNGYDEIKYFVRHGDILLFESEWIRDDFDIHRWNTAQGNIPEGFRYGNAIGRRTQS